jgi:hypothetical protein
LLATLHSLLHRAAIQFQIQDYLLCLDDCNYILEKLRRSSSSSNVRAYVQASRTAIQLGALPQALRLIEKGLDEHGPTHGALQKDARNVQRVLAMQAQGWDQLSTGQGDLWDALERSSVRRVLFTRRRPSRFGIGFDRFRLAIDQAGLDAACPKSKIRKPVGYGDKPSF